MSRDSFDIHKFVSRWKTKVLFCLQKLLSSCYNLITFIQGWNFILPSRLLRAMRLLWPKSKITQQQAKTEGVFHHLQSSPTCCSLSHWHQWQHLCPSQLTSLSVFWCSVVTQANSSLASREEACKKGQQRQMEQHWGRSTKDVKSIKLENNKHNLQTVM